jgi:hypothetical protein
MAGGMRRPPRLWEQKLEQMIRGVSRGATAASTGNADQGLPPGPGGANDQSGEDTPVVDPDPTTPRLPATPSVFAAIGGLSIIWTGLDDDGDPFPAGTTVQVHVSDTTGFTPDGSSQRGILGSGERLEVTGLTSGTTYYIVFVLVGPDGVVGEPSAEQSATAGFVLSTNIGNGEITADLVSFDATAIGGIQQFVGTTAPPITGSGTTQLPKNGSTWINTTEGSYYTLTAGAWVKRQWDSDAIAVGAISTLQIATGAITADSAIIADAAIGDAKIANLSASKLTAGTIDASVITVNNLDADKITAGTITGLQFRTAASGERIKMADSTAEYGRHSIEFYGTNSVRYMAMSQINNVFVMVGNTVIAGALSVGSLTSTGNISSSSNVSSQTLTVAGSNVDMLGVFNNNTTGIDEVGIVSGTGRLRRISSTQAIKYDMATLSGELSESVDAERQLGTATVTPQNVLNIAVTEFSVIDRIFPEPLPDGEEGELPPPEPVATDRRVLGFIADDVADKFPIAATEDEDGNPAGVLDTAILAALLTVVKEQQATIEDLSARLDALEA